MAKSRSTMCREFAMEKTARMLLMGALSEGAAGGAVRGEATRVCQPQPWMTMSRTRRRARAHGSRPGRMQISPPSGEAIDSGLDGGEIADAFDAIPDAAGAASLFTGERMNDRAAIFNVARREAAAGTAGPRDFGERNAMITNPFRLACIDQGRGLAMPWARTGKIQ